VVVPAQVEMAELAVAPTVAGAQKAAYEALDRVKWENGFCRRDIGWRAVDKDPNS
jgi:phosphoribosylamine--glycine ligase